ncbi:MAG: lamin tail domain-containing protein [Verrucomicrobiales bacterium]
MKSPLWFIRSSLTRLLLAVLPTIPLAEAGTFSVVTLTGDADSGIAADAAFSHAINVNDTPNLTVNGAVFTGSPGGANPFTNNYSTTGLTAGLAGFNAAAVDGLTGAVVGLFTNSVYSGNPETLTLKNLRIGQQYETTFYNAANGTPGSRFQTITATGGDTIHFDQNGQPGSLLKYAFIATSNTMTFTLTPDVPANTFYMFAFSNQQTGFKALLTDNFYAPSNPNTSDLNFNLAARQGGPLGTIPWVSAGDAQVGNPAGSINSGHYLRLAGTTAMAALDHNFNGADGVGGLAISFDLAPDVGASGATAWCAINLGQAAADKLGAVNGTHQHFGVLFRGSGRLQAYDGSTVVSPSPEPVWSSTAVTNQLHHIELLITDAGDGNPFDGAGEARIEVYADGVLRYTFTKTGGYAQNYIDFQSSQIGGIDNLVIARINATPAPPTFFAQPQSQTVWRGDAFTLTAGAFGFPAFTYQWYRDGVAIPGATGATYTLTDATGAGGVYTVVATNSSGSTTSAAATVNVVAPTRAQLTWEAAGASSRRTGLAISEIHYHPPARVDGRNLEFIELYNSNPWTENLEGYRLTGDVDFAFPTGAQIAGKGYLVVAKVPADVQAVYGLSGVLGGFVQNLSNEGSTLRLRKPSGAIVLEVSWNDHAPWPIAPDGTGHSLVLVRASYGEASAQAWDASASIGGSPGAGDTPPSSALDHVTINEVLARSDAPLVDFVELRNVAPDAVDLSGCKLSDDPAALGKFVIPAGTALAAGASLSFTETQLGFALSAEGESLYFTNPAVTRVLDSVRFGGSAANVSLGRANDREGPFQPLAISTPGGANSGPWTPDVLISEIFFDPISGDDQDEWIELYNPGASSVDVSGWKFTDGVSFTIPAGTSIQAGARLVVAKDAARTRANHPALDPALVVGDYSGALSNGGDHLTIVRPETVGTLNIGVEVDTVTYRKAGRWSRWAAGGGSSLEVTDLRADRTLAGTWADSDESAKAPWTTVSVTGPLDHGHTALAGADRVQFFLMGAGETLVDDVTVAPGNVGNVVTNGGFESGISGWTVQGNQSRSSVASGAGFGGGTALQLRASDDGDPDGNRVYRALTSTLAPNTTGTISAKARWLRGHPELILRLKGGYLEAFGALIVPANLGTPGAPNSRAVANAGPAIRDVSHRPLLPPAGTPIRVSARVSDPDGINTATLRWRVETTATFTNAAMRDDGLGGDLFPADGLFTGTIPAQNAGTLVVFRIESTDAALSAAGAVFPPDAPAHECLVRVGEPAQGGGFDAYRVWLTAVNVGTWTNRAKFSNEPLDVTFVYGGVRAVYGGGAWYAGSEASTPQYTSPVSGGLLPGYNITLPDHDRVLDEDHFTLDLPIRDTTDQREALMFWMAEQLRLPNLHRRYVHLFVNGLRRGVIYDDIQQPDQTVLDEFFPGDSDGHLYKSNNWNEGADNGNATSAGVSNILRHYDTAGQHKLARYRWNWRPRASRSANEFGDIFTLIDAVNVPTTAANYQAAIESVVDVENWMRTFAFHDLCSYWDALGNPNTKNTYLYKPLAGHWTQFTWDMDVGLGVFNDPTNAALFPPTADPRLDALQAFAPFRRIYWRTIHEAFATFFSGAGVTEQLQRKYEALAANVPGIVSPFVASGAYGLSIPQWIDQRRAFIQTQLNGVAANFAITSPSNVTVASPSVTITGTAPVSVERLTVNEVELPVVWSSVTSWRITFVPAAGTNTYVVRALDYNGTQIGTGTVTVTFTGTNAWPPLRLNEWMASNGGSVLDPSDGDSDDWIELFNPTADAVNLTGWRLSDSTPTPAEFIFPAGYSIAAGGRLIAWCDDETIQSAAPNSVHLPFRLSASGETLTLTAPDGTVVDTVTFGQQVNDVSQGRAPDGSLTVDFLAAPSEGTANSAVIAAPIATITSTTLGDVTIIVNTTPGFDYQLQTKENLSELAWTNRGAPITATGNTLTFSDSMSDNSRRFYRVVRSP